MRHPVPGICRPLGKMLAHSWVWHTQPNHPPSQLQNIQHSHESHQWSDNHLHLPIILLAFQWFSPNLNHFRGCWAIELILGSTILQSGNTFCNLTEPINQIHSLKFLQHHPHISTTSRNWRNRAKSASAEVVVSGIDLIILNCILISQVTQLPSIYLSAIEYQLHHRWTDPIYLSQSNDIAIQTMNYICQANNYKYG